jgi:hypothetical protein
MVTILLLAGPSFSAAAEGSLDSRVGPDGSLQNRLVITKPGLWIINDPRMILWIRQDDDWPPSAPRYRVGLEAAGLAVGPLLLTGGLRELGDPHPAGARGTAWQEATGSRLDRGVAPAARRGLSVAPGFLPAAGSIIRVEDGVTAALSAGSLSREVTALPGGRAEVVVAASHPGPGPAAEPADIPWFGRTFAPSDMLHLLCRGRLSVSSGATALDVGPAGGISLSQTFRPGWWCRVAAHTESTVTTNSSTSPPDSRNVLEVEVDGRLSLSSPTYRLPYAELPSEAARAALSIRAGRDDRVGIAADGRVTMSWQPAAAVPGVPFTLRGLQLESAEVDIAAYTTVGRWGMDLATSADLDWVDATSGTPAGTGIDGAATGDFRSTHTLYVAPVILAGLRYEPRKHPEPARPAADNPAPVVQPRARAYPVTAGVSVRLSSENDFTVGPRDTSAAAAGDPTTDDLRIECAGDLGFGSGGAGSDAPVRMSGSFRLAAGEESWRVDQAAAKCRMSFQSGSSKYRVGVDLDWDSGSDPRLTWGASLGWTVRSVTTGE